MITKFDKARALVEITQEEAYELLNLTLDEINEIHLIQGAVADLWHMQANDFEADPIDRNTVEITMNFIHRGEPLELKAQAVSIMEAARAILTAQTMGQNLGAQTPATDKLKPTSYH